MLSDRRGAAVVEFAVLLPILLMMVAGAVEYGRGFAFSTHLRQSAVAGAELALMRAPAANTTTALAHIKTEAQTVSGVPAGNVTVELYRHCNDVKQATYGAACPAGQRQADYVRVNVIGSYTPMLDFSRFFGTRRTSTTLNLTHEAVVRVR